MVSIGRRTPVLVLAAVAVAAGLAVLVALVARRLRGRKDGFAFTGSRTRVTDKNHRNLIRTWCASGRTFTALKANEDYAFLGDKYSDGAAWVACNAGMKKWHEKALKRGTDGGDTGGVLVNRCAGGRTCENPSLRVTHPCANIEGDKCCLYKDQWGDKRGKGGLQNCVSGEGTRDADTYAREVLARQTGAYRGANWRCMRDGRYTGKKVYLEAKDYRVPFDSLRQWTTSACNREHPDECGGNCTAYT